MELIKNKTQFIHQSKKDWGIGTYIDSNGKYITIDFENVGEKVLSIDLIKDYLVPLTPAPTQNIIDSMSNELFNKNKTDSVQQKTDYSTKDNHEHTQDNQHSAGFIQYEGQDIKIGGKNFIEATEDNDTVIFNESYTIVGDMYGGKKIHALYDLTVIGDLNIDECVVNGNLTVLGNSIFLTVSCANTFICNGDVSANKIYVGGDFVAKSAKCNELICDGNSLIQTTIEINEKADIAKTIVTYEGIIGEGSFSAQVAIANDYFDFNGEKEGKILELETDTTVNDTPKDKNNSAISLQEHLDAITTIMSDEYSSCVQNEEDDIFRVLHELCDKVNAAGLFLPNYEKMFRNLVDLSYDDEISTLPDFLKVLEASQELPSCLLEYETVEHVTKKMFAKARSKVGDLVFEPSSLIEFATALSTVVKYESEYCEEKEFIYDLIFESIGLKYSTVLKAVERNHTAAKVETDFVYATETDNITPVPKSNESKDEFLSKKITHLAKKVGLTDTELERLSAIKVKTCNDLIKTDDVKLTSIFGKKPFLANHLIQIRDKLKAQSDELD